MSRLTYASSATICAAIRVKSTVQFAKSDDTLWAGADMNMWSIAEIPLGFGVLCLPSMRKMFTESPWISKLRSSVGSLRKTSSKQDPMTFELEESQHFAKVGAGAEKSGVFGRTVSTESAS